MPSVVNIAAFTDRGQALAHRLAALIHANDTDTHVAVARVKNLSNYLANVFEYSNQLIFIGAIGIAVRAVAPYLKSKTSDPAVLVIDDAGCYVIPILSGHLGLANRHARRYAEMLRATPVITTATDVNGVFAFDEFAAMAGFTVYNPPVIKHIASAMLHGIEVGLYSELTVTGSLPPLVNRQTGGPMGVVISMDPTLKPFVKTLNLVPKCLHVGIGTRRDVPPEQLLQLLEECLHDLDIPAAALAAIATIELKRDEPAIVELARHYRVPLNVYSADELNNVADRFSQSDFVQATTGTANVCEAAAFLSSRQGQLIRAKQAQNGMTLAIALEDRSVRFDIIEKGA